LNRDEKRLFIKALGFVSLIFTFIASASILLWYYVPLEKRLLFMALFGCVLLASAFLIISYFFGSLFKTKRSLDFLIQETLHELNVPLSVIKANLSMLLNMESEGKKRQRLERIAQSCEDLHRLYTEVDYYIKREIRTETKEIFDFQPMILNMTQTFQDLDNSAPFCMDVPSLMLFSDRHGLSKVMTNLLSNALKYNQNNRPIRIFLEGNTLIVQDEGLGMSEAELFLVFDRYYQADASSDGFGIGLGLVKAYCDEHKILLAIHSEKGKGTSIRLDLSNLLSKK